MNEPNQDASDLAAFSPESEGQEKPVRSGEAERKTVKKRRIEPPVLVIEPRKRPPSAPKRRGGEESVSLNLESMVHDLLSKVREAEDQLQEKEEAIALLRDQTVTMARKILLSREGAAKPQSEEDGSEESDSVAMEALDFFTRAFYPGSSSREVPVSLESPPASPAAAKGPGTEKLARVARESKGARAQKPAAAQHGAPGAGGRACPACARHLRKARCLNVQILVCLSCRGIFLDARAVRQLARLLPWMHYVEQFLNSASRGLPSPQKTAKTKTQPIA